jgi:hypothetical protein
MADNTLQYRWIVRLVTNLKQLLQEQTAFVAGDLLWYPVQVDEPPVPAQAPDAMVVLGRPDGQRTFTNAAATNSGKRATLRPRLSLKFSPPATALGKCWRSKLSTASMGS